MLILSSRRKVRADSNKMYRAVIVAIHPTSSSENEEIYSALKIFSDYRTNLSDCRCTTSADRVSGCPVNILETKTGQSYLCIATYNNHNALNVCQLCLFKLMSSTKPKYFVGAPLVQVHEVELINLEKGS